ncbi:MAG: AMP-binding protein [Armatimonadota bacterium]
MRISDIIAGHAEQTPDAPAMLAPGRAALDYRRLWEQVERTAAALRVRGVGRGDRVAVVLPNGPEMAVAFLAVASCAACAPLNPAYRRQEFDFYLGDLGAKALIVAAGEDSPARDAAATLGIPMIELTPDGGAEAGVFTFSGGEQGGQAVFSEPDDIALVLHTSGTTSRPKIVPLTQANLCTSAENIRRTLALTPADRCLNVMPLFHIHGLLGALLSSLSAGAGVICTPGFSAAEFFSWLRDCQPTWYTAVPTMHQAILTRAGQGEHPDGCLLRFIRSSSASLPPPVMAELERLFDAPVVEAYGMTEAAHQMASNPLPPRPRKPGSVGPAAGPEVAIMDADGALLPAEEVGEVVIRGANVTGGYENNPAANASAFTGGWFRTGDQGYLDADGYLFLTGRLKEIINRGGEKIAPREVDEALLAHPAVAQAVAFALPHRQLGETVAAAVVLREGAVISEYELREFVAARLVDFKVPARVIFLPEIPKGPTGKLQRIGLAERLGLEPAGVDLAAAQAAYAPPRTPLETALADVWAQMLGIERVGIDDDFTALGGDSLQAMRLVSRLRETYQVEFSLLEFFGQPTIAGQAALILQRQAELLADDELERLLAEIEE